MNSQNKAFVFANWKMYLDLKESQNLAKFMVEKKMEDGISVAIFPSALSFSEVKKELFGSQVGIGAQNAYWLDKGGYTGENSVVMYQAAGAQYILIGHSERRHLFGETDEDVRKKIVATVVNKLVPVLCVGETQKEKDNNRTEEVVERQLQSALTNLLVDDGDKIFIAYEPVWAIGTGRDCSAGDATKVQQKIAELAKEILPNVEFYFLYGGSVNSENISQHLADKNVDGVLVGGASSKAESLSDIIESAENFIKNI
jgi:triosephosphate isomerase